MHSSSMNIEDGHTHLVEGSDAHLVDRCTKRADDWVFSSSTGGETFVLYSFWWPCSWHIERVALPSRVGDKVKHQRKHGQGRRTASADEQSVQRTAELPSA